MKTTVIVLCRVNSTRLPGKILMQIEGLPMIAHLTQKILSVIDRSHLIIATSDQESDNPIASFCKKNEIQIHRGSLENVAKRFRDAANSSGSDYAIRINGDNLFVDTELLTKMINTAELGEYDFLTNVPGRTYPFGMSIEIVNTKFYNRIYEQIIRGNEHFQEHVTVCLYENPSIAKTCTFKNELNTNSERIHLAVDTPADFEIAKSIMSRVNDANKPYTLKDILMYYNQVKGG